MKCIFSIAALTVFSTAAHAEYVTGGDMSLICPTPMAMEQAGNAILNMPPDTDVYKLVEGVGCHIVMKGLKFVPSELNMQGGTVRGILFAPDGQAFNVFINRSGIVEK